MGLEIPSIGMWLININDGCQPSTPPWRDYSIGRPGLHGARKFESYLEVLETFGKTYTLTSIDFHIEIYISGVS